MKKSIHQSGLNMLFKCGVQYEFRYLKGLRIPPAAALIIGSGLHKGAELSFNEKWEKKTLPAVDAVTDAARDEVINRIDKEGLLLESEMDSPSIAKANCIDQAVGLAKFHRETLAEMITPKIKPEQEFSVSLPDIGWSLDGRIDLIDTDGNLRDLKSAAKSPTENTVRESLQLTAYALPIYLETKQAEIGVALDTIVKLKGGPKLVQQVDVRGQVDFERLINRIGAAVKTIETGAFSPAYPGSWWCSEKWCGYWKICKYRNR